MKAASPGLCIRPRSEADLPALVQALRAVHEASGYPAEWPEDPAAFVEAGVAAADAKAWVAVLGSREVGGEKTGGEVVGQVTLRRLPAVSRIDWHTLTGGHAPETLALLARLFVHPQAQGHGAARALLGKACAAARQQGLQPMLDVYPESTRAIALYERLGWRKTGEYVGFWKRKGEHPTVLVYLPPTH